MVFLSRFTLTPEDVEAITSREVPVGKRFFNAMNKAERIRNDCRVLMAGEEGPTKAGYAGFFSLIHIQVREGLPSPYKIRHYEYNVWIS